MAEESSTRRWRIGTRGSTLALAQAGELKDRLEEVHPDLAVEIVTLITTGDIRRDRPLAEIGGKGLFTKEIDEALLDGRIDLAAHSYKDVPGHVPATIAFPCALEREDARDCLVAPQAPHLSRLAPQAPHLSGLAPSARRLSELAPGARVGTSAPRRAALLRAGWPSLTALPVRGNVDTRLRKLDQGEFDALILAAAGLNRLGLQARAQAPLSPEEMLPAVGQGVIAVACRAGDEAARRLLAAANHLPTDTCVAAERAVLAAMHASCNAPLAAYGVLEGDSLWLRALVALPDGSEIHRSERRAPAGDGAAIGAEVGRQLMAMASPALRALLV